MRILRLTDGKGKSMESDCLIGLQAEQIEAAKWHLKMARTSLDNLLPHCQNKELAESALRGIEWFEGHVCFCDDDPAATEMLAAKLLLGYALDQLKQNA